MKARFTGKPNAAALNELGAWFGGQKNYSCAADAFAASLQQDPKQPDFAHVAFMFGASLYYAGDNKEAIVALQQAEESGYNEIRLHLVLARAQEAAHATPEAEAEWRAALEIDPDHSYALDSLSNDLIADRNYKAIIELLDTPRALPQRTVQQEVNLGLAYAGSEKPEKAAEVLRDAVNTYPDSLQLAAQLADVLTKSGRNEEAGTVLMVARERHASSPGTSTP
jgi:tetratricopeptide (TPR) repeat protein